MQGGGKTKWGENHINLGDIGIQGNLKADALAKQAAAIAHNCIYKLDNIIKYNTFFNPINVDIQKDLILLNKWYKKKENKIGYKDNKVF